VRRLSGVDEMLRGCGQTIIDAGEAIVIEAPNGGGRWPHHLILVKGR